MSYFKAKYETWALEISFYIIHIRICQCSAFIKTGNISEFIRRVLKKLEKKGLF